MWQASCPLPLGNPLGLQQREMKLQLSLLPTRNFVDKLATIPLANPLSCPCCHLKSFQEGFHIIHTLLEFLQGEFGCWRSGVFYHLWSLDDLQYLFLLICNLLMVLLMSPLILLMSPLILVMSPFIMLSSMLVCQKPLGHQSI